MCLMFCVDVCVEQDILKTVALIAYSRLVLRDWFYDQTWSMLHGIMDHASGLGWSI